MSFENIQLPPFLLQDLYKNFLIDDKPDLLLSDPLQNSKLPVLGANKKNILILIEEPGKTIVDKKNLAFLEGILTACHLKIEDVTVINIHNRAGINYDDLVKQFTSEKVLLFGVEPTQINLPLVFPHNQIQQHISQLYVCFPSLRVIAGDKTNKKALWATLQKLFKLI